MLRRLVVGLMILLLSEPARGEGRSVAVLEPSGSGLDEAARSFFRAAVEDALEKEGYAVVARRTLARIAEEQRGVAACRSEACLAAWAGASGAAAAVAIFVEKMPSGDEAAASYTARLEVYDAGSGIRSVGDEQRCSRCSETEMSRHLATAARAAIAVRPPPVILVEPLAPGAQPPGGSPPPRGATAWRGAATLALGVTALGLGIAAVGVGAKLLAIDGEGTCDLVAPAETCPKIYRTQAGGVVLAALGSAAVVAGTALVVVGARALRVPAKKDVWLAPTLGGMMLGGRFP